MRTEYTIKITDNKGKAQFSTYPKKYADEKAMKARDFWGKKEGYNVEYFKVIWNGSSFVKAEKIW